MISFVIGLLTITTYLYIFSLPKKIRLSFLSLINSATDNFEKTLYHLNIFFETISMKMQRWESAIKRKTN